jgi:hypothetical protein
MRLIIKFKHNRITLHDKKGPQLDGWEGARAGRTTGEKLWMSSSSFSPRALSCSGSFQRKTPVRTAIDERIVMTPTKSNSAMGTSKAYPFLRRKTILFLPLKVLQVGALGLPHFVKHSAYLSGGADGGREWVEH